MNENNKPVATPLAEPTIDSHLQVRAALLLLFMLMMVVGAILYVMYARGAFETSQKLVLVADDSEGVSVGMDLTFSGFPVGRVGRIELSPEGNARMIVEVPHRDAHWLRSSSIFTLERGLVGGAKLRAHTGVLTDPALEDGATRKVLVGDATAEIPRMVGAAKELVENLKALTKSGSSLDASLANAKQLTAKMNSEGGALGAIMGDEKNTQKLMATIDKSNVLLAQMSALAARANSIAGKADAQVFGPTGLMKDTQATVKETQATVVQLNGMLTDVRESLKKVDKILIETQAASENIKTGTTDLGSLRAEVDASLRKVDQLVNELNRKWPFKRDAEIKLP
jgi:phospholipid/cholesterol/gamma-HCH transport system substrate-binding protein